jgi:hypothetical protein
METEIQRWWYPNMEQQFRETHTLNSKQARHKSQSWFAPTIGDEPLS